MTVLRLNPDMTDSPREILLYSLHGQLISQGTMKGPIEKILETALENHSSGLYICYIRNHGTEQMIKVFKP